MFYLGVVRLAVLGICSQTKHTPCASHCSTDDCRMEGCIHQLSEAPLELIHWCLHCSILQWGLHGKSWLEPWSLCNWSQCASHWHIFCQYVVDSAIPVPAAPAAFATNPPPPPACVGPLTCAMKSRAQAQMVEAPPASTIVPTAGPSTPPYKLRRKEPEIATMQSPDVIIDSSADNTPKKTDKWSANIAELLDPQLELPFAINWQCILLW